MNRAHCLQEGIIQCGHRKINTSFECHHFPLLFIAGDVSDSVALEHIVKCMPSSDLRGHIEMVMTKSNLPKVPVTERRNEVPVLYLLEVEGNGAQCLNVGCAFKINGRITISNAEILQCHTFTKCIVCAVVPPGYAIDDLCSPPESYQVHSCFGLGDITSDHVGIDSQAASAIDPNPTREPSAVTSNGQIVTPDPAAEQIQQEVRSPSERVSPTLPWSAKPHDTTVLNIRSNQHPIAPTKKKERPTAKPSCKKEAVSKQVQLASPPNDQDVEMTDVSGDHLTKRGTKVGTVSCGSDDPKESYGSAKPSNDDMEIDSEGANPDHLQQKQVDQVQSVGGNKPSKETIAAIASPQKPRHDLGRPASPKKLSSSSVANNNNASRPPGITILQRSAILAKGKERKEQALAKGLDSRHCPKSGKRQAKTGHPVAQPKGAPPTNVSSFFQKAVETPIQSHPHEIDELEQTAQEDIVIDIEQDDLERILAEENIMKQSIHEANIKWHSKDEEEFRVLAGKYALDFLRSMNGTLCYLTVAFRMLAKAPWTARMVCVHIRQAAIYAISRGWFVNTLATHGIHFSRAELALAAGTFLGDLKPNLPDDTDQPLFLLIHELPHICADLFSTGNAVCKYCGRSKSVPIPTFATAISCSSTSWESLRHCLERGCTPFPWISDPGDSSWHESDCSRHDVDIIDIQFGPWAYVSFRGDEVEEFPPYATVAEILQDTSLEHQGLAIRAMVCCNVQETKARHFWLLEIENSKPAGLYDSLHGLMPITLEATKKLRVTGFLLVKSQSCCPVLKSKELELVAGKPVRKERQSAPIAVRSRSAWLRASQQQLTKSSAKVKKTAVKRSPTEQILLGRFFDNAKNHSRAKPTSKARGTTVTSGQEVVNGGSTRIAEGKPEAVAVPDCRAPSCAQDTTDEAHQIDAVGVSIGQTEEHHANCHSKIPPIADPDKTLSGGNKDSIKRGVVKADYGVISLFDGVSTVVPTLHKKIG